MNSDNYQRGMDQQEVNNMPTFKFKEKEKKE